MAQLRDETGKRYGRLVVVERAGTKGTYAAWRCRCDCGNETMASGKHLRNGNTASCGCLIRDTNVAKGTKHGLTPKGGRVPPEYDAWGHMVQRCTNPENAAWESYGGRGIKIDPEWLDFRNFLRDVGPRPSRNHSIDRIDVNGHYEPGNVRWATRLEQNRNKRSNRIIEYRGRRMCLAEAAEYSPVRQETIRQRLNSGWPVQSAVETPAYQRGM